MKPAMLLLAAFIGLLYAHQVQPAAARIWHILPDGTGEAPTIQAGIDSAVAGDSVELACGMYYEHDILMKSGVALRSEAGLPDCATIDAQQNGRVIVCDELNQNTEIAGLTITGGRVASNADNGGGMLCVNSPLTISHCDFVENYAIYRGGAICFEQCNAMVTDCRFIANEGEMGGGGGVFWYASDGEMRSCLFEANVGIDGAGLYCRQSSPIVEWCTFLNNDGWFFGGGVYCESNASPEFDHCSLVGNEAHWGAGIMTAADSYPTMENSIVAFNLDGAGIHCFDTTTYLTLACGDVFGNAGGGYSGAIDDQTGIDGNIAADPLFCDLAAGDIRLFDASPCLPANNDCGVLMGAWDDGCTTTPVVDSPPATLRLAQNYPNPFNPQTTIAFALDEPQRAEIAVYGLNGKLLIVLANRTFAAGDHSVVWNGQDASGRAVPSGTYVVRLLTTSSTQTRKLLLLR